MTKRLTTEAATVEPKTSKPKPSLREWIARRQMLIN
jgi:hypothetical protein